MTAGLKLTGAIVFLVLFAAAPAAADGRDWRELSRLSADDPAGFAFFDALGFYDFLADTAASYQARPAPALVNVFVSSEEWQELSGQVYDLQRIFAAFEAAWEDAHIDPALEAEILLWFGTGFGQRVIESQVATSQQLASRSGREAAREALHAAEARSDPIVAALISYRDELGSVDRALAAQLNREASFARGVADVTGAPTDVGDFTLPDAVLAERRAAMERWRLVTAFADFGAFSPEEVARIRAFNASPAGRELFRAAHRAYGQVFEEAAFRLGQAAARVMLHDDL